MAEQNETHFEVIDNNKAKAHEEQTTIKRGENIGKKKIWRKRKLSLTIMGLSYKIVP